ncbi:Ig domain protein group 2 domain protein [Elysia marginata]|uniref:Ig domain protein group 2 domain protein n=1 Tax=Elysia marginata TaxID=1093978 RepID=A0AAV4G4W0_9GAST|nr:Ig domain protein group 2 domain protein [Elysia marginata]
MGETQQLTATFTPKNASDKTIKSWSSDKPGIATVDTNGLVTGVSAGTATITVTTNDGNKTATATVTVIAAQPGTTTPKIAVTGVSLNSVSDLERGKTKQLTANVTPSNASDKTIKSWSSNKPGIATVDPNGLVTGVSAGTATITVTTNDGNKTATATVTVIATQPGTTTPKIAVTGVSLSPNSVSNLEKGKTQQLTANVTPSNATDKTIKSWSSNNKRVATLRATVTPSNATNKTISWSSDNKTVATVSDKGLVTGVSAGTATITVTTNDGNKTATAKITVIAPVTGVSLSSNSVSDLERGKTKQLTATVTPSNATDKTISWSSDNKTVATVDPNGLVTGVSAGTATITVTTNDGNKTATATVTVIAPVTGGTGK